MLSREEIAQRQTLLDTHRRHLAHSLAQRTKFGIATPFYVKEEIREAREQIRSIKANLRAANIACEDQASDEATDERRHIWYFVPSFLFGTAQIAVISAAVLGLLQYAQILPLLFVLVLTVTGCLVCIYVALKSTSGAEVWGRIGLVAIPFPALIGIGAARMWEGNIGLTTFTLIAVGSVVLATGCCTLLTMPRLTGVTNQNAVNTQASHSDYSKAIRWFAVSGLLVSLVILIASAAMCFSAPTKRIILLANFYQDERSPTIPRRST